VEAGSGGGGSKLQGPCPSRSRSRFQAPGSRLQASGVLLRCATVGRRGEGEEESRLERMVVAKKWMAAGATAVRPSATALRNVCSLARPPGSNVWS
jgi:hypothetical protein